MNPEAKLAIVKEVRQKSSQMERSRQDLKVHIENLSAEEKCLSSYTSELTKMKHLKEMKLREIKLMERDIACIEVLVEQADAARILLVRFNSYLFCIL